MSKVAYYLQEHLVGEVMTSDDARAYFATDASIFSVVPTVVVYPKNENDVRKTTRFAWQLAERGRILPITARGGGTDQSGAAIGGGIILALPAHMNHMLELDSKSGLVLVQPGLNFGKLQQALETHGRFLPPAPASLEYSTIGGAIANNAGGNKSIKYGNMGNYVRNLRVVLSNGEVIETGPQSRKDLNRKLGLSSFEGEIYRALDSLLEENAHLLGSLKLPVTRNVAGYNLADIKTKDGFNLTPLFVGSQGTLGLITEATLETEINNTETSLLGGYFDDIAKAHQAILQLRELGNPPSTLEMVDDRLFTLLAKLNPSLLKELTPTPLPKVFLLVELNDSSEHTRKQFTKKAVKVFERFATNHEVASDQTAKEKLWKIREAAASLVLHSDHNLKAVPITNGAIVPLEKYEEFLNGLHELAARNHLEAAVWGHAGDASLQLQPYLDISQVGDRQKLFRMMDDYYSLAIDLGGSTSSEQNDGRLRAPYLAKLYGPEVYELFQKVKQIFDPYGILNPGVKVNVELGDIKSLLRHEYSLGGWYEHMPRS